MLTGVSSTEWLGNHANRYPQARGRSELAGGAAARRETAGANALLNDLLRKAAADERSRVRSEATRLSRSSAADLEGTGNDEAGRDAALNTAPNPMTITDFAP